MERQAFSIDDALRRYFRQPKAFRKIMLDTNTLVSGSFAVQYFLHTEFADADIDMYIGPGPRPQTESDKDESTGKPVLSWTNAQRVIDHLTKVEDYDWCSDTNSYINIHHIEVASPHGSLPVPRSAPLTAPITGKDLLRAPSPQRSLQLAQDPARPAEDRSSDEHSADLLRDSHPQLHHWQGRVLPLSRTDVSEESVSVERSEDV